jgi:hypothetical protein
MCFVSYIEVTGVLLNFHSFHKRVKFLYVLPTNPNISTSIFGKFSQQILQNNHKRIKFVSEYFCYGISWIDNSPYFSTNINLMFN